MLIPAQSSKGPAGYFTKFVKASKCLILLGRLKDQQTSSVNFAKANMCPFLLDRLKDQQVKSIKYVKEICINDP